MAYKHLSRIAAGIRNIRRFHVDFSGHWARIPINCSIDHLKQKELVLKKRDGKAFTKTEREYYSRIVRKKLDAIASEEVAELANKLIRI